jgi:hypothetical protein
VVLAGVLALLALQSPQPWGGLWLLVPGCLAASLLAAWRFGRWGVLVPIVLFIAALVTEGMGSLWVWWIPVASLSGTWMGLREEGGGPAAGQQAWMLLPVLLLAAGLPLMLGYPKLIAIVANALRENDAHSLELLKQLGIAAERQVELERTLAEVTPIREHILPNVLPSVIFVWMVLLVSAGRALSSRVARLLKWPPLSRASFRAWRLPDGVLWILLASLAMLVAQWRDAIPTAWTLLINAALGYCVQGVAVVESVLLARGVPLSVIVLTMLFVFTVASPVFMLTTAALGLSDVWLDYRRLEPHPEEEHPQE